VDPAHAPLLPTDKLYCVPRRYDLATLFAVSLAFSLMFGVMRWLAFEAVSFFIIAGLVAIVGISQASLFRGKSPRKASILAGTIYWIPFMLISATQEPALSEAIVVGSVCALLPAALLGYLVGVLIGGVFLVADLLRQCLSRHRRT
jgi:hypothetical protein